MKHLQYSLKILPTLCLLLVIMLSCERDVVLIPEPEVTYTIEGVVVNGQRLQQITGAINQSITLTNTNSYLLSGIVFVEDTLTIEPGTVIYAATTPISALVVQRSALIIADGTSADPIIFTSVNELQSSADFGDWGGVHINGQASINSRSSGLQAIIGKYGRTDGSFNDQDNSGSLRYVRVEYAGKDMNGSSGGFNLNGVGNATKLDYIQVYKCRSNGVRFRGGTVRMKHALSTQTRGKGFRWDAGWRGFGQYWVINYPMTVNDTLTAIEGRSGALDNPPISAPILSNVTITGLGSSSDDPQIRGVRFRDSTHGKMYNSIITRCRRGVRADNSQAYIEAGTLVFAHNNLFDNSPDYYTGSNSDAGSFENPIFNNTNNIITMNGFLGVDSDNPFPIATTNSWFEEANYKGAVRLENNWAFGWSR